MGNKKFNMHDIQNSYNSHNLLCKLAEFIVYSNSNEVVIDFTRVSFFAANLFSVLGCILAECNRSQEMQIGCINISDNTTLSMHKTGFSKHFKQIKQIGQVLDKYHNAIEYKVFDVSAIDEYEKYITIEFFSRRDLPSMSDGVKDSINDYLLEIFKNVSDHTDSKRVYTCGQYFPKSKMLFFTVTNYGNTIRDNVNMYFINGSNDPPRNSLQWAIQEGNSTSATTTPRGLGLHLIKEFIRLNNGELFIVSDNETYELSGKKGERFLDFAYKFPGTFVTIGFNLNDTSTYFLSSEMVNDSVIEF